MDTLNFGLRLSTQEATLVASLSFIQTLKLFIKIALCVCVYYIHTRRYIVRYIDCLSVDLFVLSTH